MPCPDLDPGARVAHRVARVPLRPAHLTDEFAPAAVGRLQCPLTRSGVPSGSGQRMKTSAGSGVGVHLASSSRAGQGSGPWMTRACQRSLVPGIGVRPVSSG